MSLNIRSDEVTRMARELAELRGMTITDAVADAILRDLKTYRMPLAERLKALQHEVASYPKTGLKADKAFYDELSGGL
jgi:antitoxin VapB